MKVSRRHRKQKLEKIPYDEAATRLGDKWALCRVELKDRRVQTYKWWTPRRESADANDAVHEIAWERGVDDLKRDGLIPALDSKGYLLLVYRDPETQRSFKHLRRVLRRRPR